MLYHTLKVVGKLKVLETNAQLCARKRKPKPELSREKSL